MNQGGGGGGVGGDRDGGGSGLGMGWVGLSFNRIIAMYYIADTWDSLLSPIQTQSRPTMSNQKS